MESVIIRLFDLQLKLLVIMRVSIIDAYNEFVMQA